MSKTSLRKQRILGLLPRIYTAQPRQSAVGAVIDMMDETLARLDDDMRQVMRDHWVDFASDKISTDETANDSGEISSLENLGRLLEIRRLPGEKTEAYRQRLILTSDIFMRGLTSPEALLRLAIVTLGAEPCAAIRREHDATIIAGVPLGTRARCPVCRGEAQGECPNRQRQVLQATLIDNPLVPQQLTTTLALDKDHPAAEFTLSNPSLVDDVAVITFRAENNAVSYPGLRNKGTNEIVFYAGKLLKGEKLQIIPPVTERELAPFRSYEQTGHHAWAARYPGGMALLTKKDGSVSNASARIFFYIGNTFDEACFALPGADEPRFTALHFDDDHFAGDEAYGENDPVARFNKAAFSIVQSMFETPRIRNGVDTWVYRTYTRQEIRSVGGDEVIDALEKAQTGNEGDDEADNILVKVPTESSTAPLAITLDWWSRPPATFRLRIPKTLWVQAAETRGALELAAAYIERARAAGVVALLDFPQPVQTIAHPISDRFSLALHYRWPELHVLDDTVPESELHKSPTEHHCLGEAPLLWQGYFDKTTLDNSYFNE